MLRKSDVIGASVRRLEDEALIRGEGRFLDDIRMPDGLYAAFVRSPYAHASFRTIDTQAAEDLPGVIAVYTMDKLRSWLSQDRLQVGMPSAAYLLEADRPVLADGEVAYVGEPVAVVIARSRYIAEDAAELVDIDYDPLPAVSSCTDAFGDDAPTVHESLPHNLIAAFDFDYGDTDALFRDAAHVFREQYSVHRGGSHSIEGRGIVAYFDELEEILTVWSSTQTPHAAKRLLCDVLGMPGDAVRVVAPDLGGGFGPKLVFYQEEAVIALCARLLRRPVKWTEDRWEHFVSSAQERDQFWDMEIAVDQDARILGIRGAMVHDYGAYTARGVNIPYGAGVAVTLPYNVPAYHLDIFVALTNKTPVSSVRGAGQPQGVFVMERLMDRVAQELGLDRAEVRRRNLVTAAQMPCTKPLMLRGGFPVVLDSGDYVATQEQALKEAGWHDFPERQARAREQGRYLGMGMANYVEGTGRGPFEGVRVRIDRSGTIFVSSGAAAMGQSTKTMLAQVVAQQLGGDMSRIDVTVGDTRVMELGIGGFNSRQTVMAGSSAHAAACKMRERVLDVAADLHDVAATDLDIVGSSIIRATDGTVLTDLAQVARATEGIAGFRLPGDGGPGLDVTEHVVIDDMCFSNGTAVVEVEVDIETGAVDVQRFCLVHDCGRIINPMIVDGQVMGGIAHGLGNTLFEWMGFDANAQPITTTFADYLLITAAEMPNLEIIHRESPSPLNALGVKGVGESGVLPSAAAVASAIDNALESVGVRITDVPLSPTQLLSMIKARQTGDAPQQAEAPHWREDARQLWMNSKQGTKNA